MNTPWQTPRAFMAAAAALISFVGATHAASAQTRPAASFYTPQALKAMGERSEAQARFYANRPAASFYTPQALKAMGERSEAQARFYANRPAATFYTPRALHALGAREEAKAVAYTAQSNSGGDGIDWTTAGVSLGALLTVMVIGGSAMAARRRPQPAALT